MASQPIYQFYAELRDYQPTMWRRFQVANNVTMAKLGYIIMTLFEMQASHLFCLDVPIAENFRNRMLETISEEDYERMFKDIFSDGEETRHYEVFLEGSDIDESDEKILDAVEYTIKQVLSDVHDKLMFTYDFGDGWDVSLVLEKIIVDKELPGKELPRVLEGEGYGIIEDSGGAYGLMEIVKAYKKKKGSQYKEYREWLGKDDLDLTAFDIDDMNFRLKKVPRIYAEIYEFSLEPTQRSIDLLDRKYQQK